MSDIHSAPKEGSACMSCWEDLSDENYLEYKSSPDEPWLPSGFCSMCVQHLITTQFTQFKTRLASTDCKAEARRLIERGPPINIRDPTALPCPDDGEVYEIWTMATNECSIPKLEGSLIGEEREKYWNELRAFYVEDEKEDTNESSTPADGDVNVAIEVTGIP